MTEEKKFCIRCNRPRAELGECVWGRYIAESDTFYIKCYPCRDEEMQEKIKAFQNSEPDTEYTDEIICPNCGQKHIQDGEREEFYTDGDHDFQCDYCDEEFAVNTSVSYTYSTYKKDKQNEETD